MHLSVLGGILDRRWSLGYSCPRFQPHFAPRQLKVFVPALCGCFVNPVVSFSSLTDGHWRYRDGNLTDFTIFIFRGPLLHTALNAIWLTWLVCSVRCLPRTSIVTALLCQHHGMLGPLIEPYPSIP